MIYLGLDLGSVTCGVSRSDSGIIASPLTTLRFKPDDYDRALDMLLELIHLFKAQELLAMQIASIHNLAFYLRLVTDARQHIEQGDFVQWKRSVIDNLGRRR